MAVGVPRCTTVVWMRLVLFRRKPSLSASRTVTSLLHLGDVEAFLQEVDADEDVELAEAEVAHDLDALEGVDVRVQVLHADADPGSSRTSCHALGEDGHVMRPPASAVVRISPRRSSTCVVAGRTSTVGSSSPGRMICSTTTPSAACSSYFAVAERGWPG